MLLEGKIALVTGAGSGIGRALAEELAWHGARLVLVGRRAEALEETRKLLGGTETVILPADITSPAERERLARRIGETYGRLDLLVNNAGVVTAGPISSQDEVGWSRMIETNLLAPMDLTRRMLPLLRKSDRGWVANVGSMFGDIGFPYFAAYSATKFGLRGWSEALRRELAADGIGVTYCAPRGTKTPAADGFAAYVKAFDMRLDPPRKVARSIVTAVARERRDIYPRGPERLFVLLQRLTPRLIDRALIRQTARARG